MIIFKYTGTISAIQQAAVSATSLMQDGSFLAQIAAQSRFDFSTATPGQIANILKNSDFEMSIELYRSKNPFSKALAFDDAIHPLIVHLNDRRLNRSVASIAATLIHEAVHAADSMDGIYSFGHNGNGASGKENSAPYWIDMLAYSILSGGQSANIVFQHDSMNNDIKV